MSGPDARTIGETSVNIRLKPRHAHLCDFKGADDTVVDRGIALFFPGPNSFTGEDIFEFQAHGGPIILDLIVEACISCGARLARPGEFSERAFLNDKLDLVQAEAIADLIDANSRQAAKLALNSLKGAFSTEVHRLFNAITDLRLYVESAIDFPEEEIDFLSDGVVDGKLNRILDQVKQVNHAAAQGAIIQEGMNIVLAGRPNSGKSTLLNALAEREVAIVTNIAGTTRDALRESIYIDGMPLHVTDTAGIRATENEVERIGIQKTWQAVEAADRILLLVDAAEFQQHNSDPLTNIKHEWPTFFDTSSLQNKLTLVVNKIDLHPDFATSIANGHPAVLLSAKSGQGLDTLRQHLSEVMGREQSSEGQFSARRRHLDALERCLNYLNAGKSQLQHAAGELLAEDLRLAQDCLGEITGKLSPDELLGKIFSSFCIGK